MLISVFYLHAFNDVALKNNKPLCYSTKESGSSDILIHFDTKGSIV